MSVPTVSEDTPGSSASTGVTDRDAARRSGESRKYVRGSSLLVGGRALSLLLNLAVQTLIVRSLSKGDYGAFAYGLGVASIVSSSVLLGLDKAVARFVAIYREKDREGAARGTVLLAMGVVLTLGITVLAVVFALRGELLGTVVKSPDALSLLLILIVIGPIEALDALVGSVVAVVLGARSVFFRRFILRPGLKLTAVLLVMLASGSVFALAVAYVCASFIGLAVHIAILVRGYRRKTAEFDRVHTRTEYPARALANYSMPLLVSELMVLATGSLLVVLLEYFHEPAAAAEYRSVLPVARLNLVVLQSFTPLFIPLVSRFYTRNDRVGINDIYWQTVTWVAVLTLPMFLMTFAFSEPIAVLFFGADYASSGTLLAVMAVGCYFSAALGFNTSTLRVCAPGRYVLAVDMTTAIVGLGTSVLLVRQFGAMGAAVGTAFTIVLQNVLTQVGLVVAKTGVHLLDRRFLSIYGCILGTVAAVVLVQQVIQPPLIVALLVAAGASGLVFVYSRSRLEIEKTFPELLKVPLLRKLLASPVSNAIALANDEKTGELTTLLEECLRAEAPDQPEAQVTLAQADRRSVSSLYVYEVAWNGREEKILVKVPGGDGIAEWLADAAAGKKDRPRLAFLVDAGRRAELEADALRVIHRHFTRLADPRWGAVRVFGYFPEHHAIAMQFMEYPNLRELVMRWQSIGSKEVDRRVETAFRNTGGWLREFHSLSAQPDVRPRHATRSEFLGHVRRVTIHLAEATGDGPYFERLAREFETVATGVLPGLLPLGLSHGDFAMRNVLVSPSSQVTVLDTSGDYATSIYEDSGYFLADMLCNPIHVIGWFTGLGRRRVSRLRMALLEGYFEGREIPIREVALYEVQSILDKWASMVLRRDRAKGKVARMKASALLFFMSPMLRGCLNERLHAAGEGAHAGSLRRSTAA